MKEAFGDSTKEAKNWKEELSRWAKEELPNVISTIASFFEELPGKMLAVGKNMVDSIWDGIQSVWNSFTAKVEGIVDSFMSGLSGKSSKALSGIGKSASIGGSLVAGSHASGLNYVPFDGYIAELHRGEMVVPAKQADDLRRGKTRPAVSVVQYISSEAKTAADLMQEAVWYQERAVLTGV